MWSGLLGDTRVSLMLFMPGTDVLCIVSSSVCLVKKASGVMSFLHVLLVLGRTISFFPDVVKIPWPASLPNH